LINFLKSNKEYYKNKYGITKIGLFGSFAKNQNIDGDSMGRTLLTLCTNRIQCGAFAAGCRSQDGVQGAAAEVG